MLSVTIFLCCTNLLFFANTLPSPPHANELSGERSLWNRRKYGEFRLVQPGPGELMGIRDLEFRPVSEARVYQDVSVRATPPPFPGTLRSSSQEDEDSKPVKGSADQEAERIKPGKNYPYLGNSDDDGSQGAGSRRIRCLCDTDDCVTDGQSTCVTSGHCYTQLLETEDGTPPITKGCIFGDTPLLCENRRPASARLWPFLICCNSELCNAATGGLLAPDEPAISPASTSDNKETPLPDESHRNHSSSGQDTIIQTTNRNTHDSIKVKYRPASDNSQSDRIVSPLASSFLIGGAVIIVVISAIGFYILRRDRRRPVTFYTDFEEPAEAHATPDDPVNNESNQGINNDPEEREPFTNALMRKPDNGIQNETCLDEAQTALKSDYEGSEVNQDDPESRC